MGRKRARIACRTCRDLKRKCDGEQPCSNCVRYEYECVYPTAKQRARRVQSSSGSINTSPNTAAATGATSSAAAISTVSDLGHNHHPHHHNATALPTPQRSISSPGVGAQQPPSATNHHHHQHHDQNRSLEANSGATFFRRLALRLDPKSAPRLHTFAWNAFLGARKAGHSHPPIAAPVTAILSLAVFRQLASVYFQKVDPTYGFVDRREVEAMADNRWGTPASTAAPRLAPAAATDPMQDAILCGIAAIGCLYSYVEAPRMEVDLVESARMLLEPTVSENPTVTSVTAWVLRVAYLRVADTPHTTWTASCILMHMVEAAGLHREPATATSYPSIAQPYPPPLPESDGDGGLPDPERRRRLTAVAQHLNIWTSFDLGRSRVSFCNATVKNPSFRPNDQTVELMDLLPYSAELDPQKSPGPAELEAALLAVMAGSHTTAPSVLCQCNLALCLCRRLLQTTVTANTAPSFLFAGRLLERVLAMCAAGIRAARQILRDRSPWHHAANVPFQVVCLLLAIDNYATAPHLRDAIDCLRSVADVYSTGATQEALRTASSLVTLHVRWKERCAAALRDVLVAVPEPGLADDHGDGTYDAANAAASAAVNAGGGTLPDLTDDAQWLSSLSEDLSTLPFFDIDEFAVPNFLKDDGGEWV